MSGFPGAAMPALYIDAQGAYLRKRGGEYLIQHDNHEIRFPAAQVERVLLLGNIQLSTQVMAELLESGVPVCFLSSHGRYRGRLSPAMHANVHLRMKQYEFVRESSLRLPVARWFVLGKIRNSKEFICRRLSDSGCDSADLRSKLKAAMEMAGRTHDLDRLRGFEGHAAHEYFAAFADVFRGSRFYWRGRNRQPPRDPVNAMLSLGYTLLMNETISAIEAIGMDVYAGMLHGGVSQSEYGKPALALDLMEEFRYLVDRMVIRLTLGKLVDPNHFEKTANGGCYMRVESRKVFFSQWEGVMRSLLKYDHRRLSYRQIIGEQAALLARALTVEDIEYRPFMP